MQMVLKTLEGRIELMIKALEAGKAREAELTGNIESLEAKISDLEIRMEEGAGVAGRAEELEKQKTELAQRLETVISMIDEALDSQASSDEM